MPDVLKESQSLHFCIRFQKLTSERHLDIRNQHAWTWLLVILLSLADCRLYLWIYIMYVIYVWHVVPSCFTYSGENVPDIFTCASICAYFPRKTVLKWHCPLPSGYHYNCKHVYVLIKHLSLFMLQSFPVICFAKYWIWAHCVKIMAPLIALHTNTAFKKFLNIQLFYLFKH